jgi:hypothetical protein
MDHRELLFLRALRTTGVLDALVETAGTAEAVAAETALTPGAAAVALEILTDLDYLAHVEDTYEPTNELLGLLTTTDVRSIGTLPAALDEAENLVGLEQTLRGGDAPGIGDRHLVHALGAAAATDRGRIRAVATAIRRAAPPQREALLVGGAPGRLAVELADRGRSVTLADRPLAVRQSAGVLAGSDVETIGTDDWSGLPESPVVVIAPGVRTEPIPWRPLVAAGAEAVEPGGHVTVVERLHEAGAADPLVHVQDLATLGRTLDRSIPTMKTYLREEGLTVAEVSKIPDTQLVAVVAEKAGD